MKTSTIIKLSVLTILIFLGGGLLTGFISFSNQEITYKTQFKQKMLERTAFYDAMWKTFAQKANIAVKNDSAFQNIVNIQMSGQKDGEQVMWKWVQQSNPAATFTEVSALYKDLSRTIEAKREEFKNLEKSLQDIQAQHTFLIDRFPGSFYNMFLGRTHIEYKPITSDRTDEVIKTGKDNDTKLF